MQKKLLKIFQASTMFLFLLAVVGLAQELEVIFKPTHRKQNLLALSRKVLRQCMLHCKRVSQLYWSKFNGL